MTRKIFQRATTTEANKIAGDQPRDHRLQASLCQVSAPLRSKRADTTDLDRDAGEICEAAKRVTAQNPIRERTPLIAHAAQSAG